MSRIASLLTVAIVGRPNVGKSTLFNRLAGRKAAIVHNVPGVTRDWKEAIGNIGALKFNLIDTAGYELGDERIPTAQRGPQKPAQGVVEGVLSRTFSKTKEAVSHSDVALWVIDGRAGVVPTDKEIAKFLHTLGHPTLIVANKCENGVDEESLRSIPRLGFGNPVLISAEHGEGMADLFNVLQPFENLFTETEAEKSERHIRVAVVGRPNVGKSTLVNAIFGRERVIVGPEAGLTRDTVPVTCNYKGNQLRLVDTAGLRKRSRVVEVLEELSAKASLRAIRASDVVVLVIDVDAERFLDQDVAICRLAVNESRAIVVAINKCDTLDPKYHNHLVARINSQLDRAFPMLTYIPTVKLSALKRELLGELVDKVIETYTRFNTKLPTPKLNNFLTEIQNVNPPPAQGKMRTRLRYITQIDTAPPAFLLFGTRTGNIPDTYLRYLTDKLRERFSLEGIPVNVSFRTTPNPYTPSLTADRTGGAVGKFAALLQKGSQKKTRKTVSR